MDITHIAEFGKLKYVHMTVDTYVGFLMATAQTGEATKHVILHCLKHFYIWEFLKLQKWIIEPYILSRYFSSFVPNGTLSIKQAFLIILKDKELWTVPVAL